MKCLTVMLSAIALLMFVSAANANTIASSTMYFNGTLSCSDAVCSGIVPMIEEGGANSGYDVYAEEGGTAWFGDDPGDGAVWTSQAIGNDNDAWPTWTPDTPDWYQYSLEFYVEGSTQKWAVRNHPGATATNPWSSNPSTYNAAGVPMSGTMNWTTMFAAETDLGAYLSGTGTGEIPGGAASKGGGAQAWDMDWSWGSEVVPLEFPGFDVTLADLGSGTYSVTMVPAPEPNAVLLVASGLIGLAISGRRRRA